MGGLSVTLNTAEQTLLNTELELSTSSNNISNASTAGYAVETAVQTANPAILTASGWLGTGATVTSITESRDSFLEQQLMNATTGDSQYKSLASELTTIQAACSDSGNTGISQALGNFFDSWTTLVQDTGNPSNQTEVYTSAQDMASAVKSAYNQLNQIATNSTGISGQISDTVDQANTLINQIAQLNTEIQRTQTSTSQPNNLIDDRYQAMDNLAQLIPVSFSQDPTSSMVNVTTTDASGPVTVVSGGTGTPITTSSTITGGQLGGLLTAQTDLNGYISQLNDFASTLITQANAITTANGGTAVFSGTDASSITASTNFLSGMSSSELSAGAQSMSDLQDTQLTFPDNSEVTLQGYLSNIQQTVGDDVKGANNSQSFYDSLKSELQTQQQSVSGVSVDEELVKVIQDQQLYESAAKVVTTCQTLMEAVINMVQ